MISGVSGLYHLKASDPEKALDKVCKEFESIFTYQLMKVMGDTIPESGLFEKSLASDIYKDMLFQSVGQAVAEKDALGFTRMLKGNVKALREYQADSGGN